MFYCPTNTALTRLFPNFGFQIITERSSLEDLPCHGTDKLSNSWVHIIRRWTDGNIFLCFLLAALLPPFYFQFHPTPQRTPKTGPPPIRRTPYPDVALGITIAPLPLQHGPGGQAPLNAAHAGGGAVNSAGCRVSGCTN